MFLDRIVQQTRLDLVQRKQELPIEQLQQRAHEQVPPRNMLEAFEPLKECWRPILIRWQ